MNPFTPDPPAAGRSSPESRAEAAQVLENAADLLLVHGRCRHALKNPAGEHCALGAIYEVQGRLAGMAVIGPWGLSEATSALMRGLPSSERWCDGDIAGWNNDPATTDDEVRDTLLLVAKKLRGEAVAS